MLTSEPTHGDEPVASEAEEYLVAALLLRPEAVLRVGKLAADDFYNPRHRTAFEALLKLYDRGDPVDLMTLAAEIDRGGMLEAVGGFAGLSKYMLITPTADNAGHYASIVRDQSFGRRLRLAASGAASRLEVGADWRDTLTNLRSALEDLEEDAHVDPPTLRAAMEAEVAAIQSGSHDDVGLLAGLGIERVCPTGLPLDKVTTVFGETGNFKTTLVSNIAWNIAAAGHVVVNVSWEDSNQLSAQRALGRATGISYGRIAARKLLECETKRIGAANPEVAERIIMADQVEPRIDAVIRLARYYKRTRNAQAVIVDYLQLLDGTGTQKHILDEAIQKAQRAAKQDRMAYIFVSQVKAEVTNRKAEDGGPRPTLDDCLGSSAMRIGTKLGLGVFRPWKYCKVPTAKGPYSEYHNLAANYPEGSAAWLREVYPRVLEVWVTKNVLGEAPVCVPCLVELETGKIEPYAR